MEREQRPGSDTRYRFVQTKASLEMFSAAMVEAQVSAESVWKVWCVMLQACPSYKGESYSVRASENRSILVPVKPTLEMFAAALQIPGMTSETAWKVWSTMVQRHDDILGWPY